MSVTQLQHVHTAVEVFQMLSMLPKGSTNEWLVHGMTTQHAKHRNGPTTLPVANGPIINLMGNLNGRRAVTT